MIAVDPHFRLALISYAVAFFFCGVGLLLGVYFLKVAAMKHAHPIGHPGSRLGCRCKPPEILHAKHRT